MKYINNKEELHIEEARLLLLFNEKTFPQNVFHYDFKYYVAFEFEMIFSTEFFDGVQQYLKKEQNSNWTFFSLEPSYEYFLHKLKFYGISIISKDDTSKEYDDFILYLPDYLDKNTSSLNILLEEVSIFPHNYNWGIYGSRSWEIAIIGFRDKDTMELFLDSFGDNRDMFYAIDEYIHDLDEMLHFSSKAKKLYSELLKNYSD